MEIRSPSNDTRVLGQTSVDPCSAEKGHTGDSVSLLTSTGTTSQTLASSAEPASTASRTESEEVRDSGTGRRVIRVTTHTLVIAIFSISIVIMSALAFFPTYWLNLGDSFTAVRAAQREAVSGLAMAIDSFLARGAAATMSTMTMLRLEAPDHLPRNHSEVLASMANMMSLRSSKTFFAALQLVVAIPGKEWRAVAHSPVMTGLPSPVVTYQRGLTAPCHWSTWDHHTHQLQPRSPPDSDARHALGYQETLEWILTDARGVFQHLVVPWNVSCKATSTTTTDGTAVRGSEAERDASCRQNLGDADSPAKPSVLPRWSHYHGHPHAFFELAVPFYVVDADGDEGVAYWEVTLQSRRAMKEALQYYNEAFQPYSHFVVMDSHKHVIALNSWNQSSRPPFHPFPAKAITMPLMRAAVDEYLRQREARATLARHRLDSLVPPQETPDADSFDYSFPFEGDQCQVFVHLIKGADGTSLVVLVATPESQLFGPVGATKRVLFGTVALTITVTVALLSAAMSGLLSHLRRLVASLEDTLLLQVDDSDNDSEPAASSPSSEPPVRARYAPFCDLHQLSDALDGLRRRVQEVKSILPDSLIIEAEPGPNAAASAVQTDSASLTTRSRRTAYSSSRSEAGDRSRVRHRAQLNLTVFNDKVNVFHQRYCTALWACRYYTNDINAFSFEEFFEAGYAAAVEFDGCLEFFRPDYIVISFGAHIHMPMHSAQACLCAMSFWNRLSERNRSQLLFLLDSREFCVGTCGKQNGRKRRVVFDVNSYMQVLRLLLSKGVRNITATQRAVAHIPEHLSVPFDVLKTTARDPLVLFELRGPVPTDPTTSQEDAHARQQMESDARIFRKAFHEMRRGQYKQAMDLYSGMAARDPLAAHLHNHCLEQVAKHNTAPLVSRPPDIHFHWIMRSMNSPFIRPVIMQYLSLAEAKGTARVSGAHGSSSSASSAAGAEVWADAPRLRPTPRCRPHKATTTDSAPDATPHVHSPSHLSRPLRASTSSAPASGPHTTAAPTTTAESTPCRDHTGVAESVVPVVQWLADDELREATSGGAVPLERTALSSLAQGSELSYAATVHESFTTPAEQGVVTFYESAPSAVVDSNGVRWVLSEMPLSYTSAGTWYAALSDDGIQARLEWMPRHRSLLNEADLTARLADLVQLQHVGVLQYFGYCVSSTSLVLITEDARDDSLHEMLSTFGPLDYLTVRRYTLDILLALVYLHSVDTIHGDLNLYTVLIGGDGVCKLAEVGWATMLNRPLPDTPDRSASEWDKETLVHMAPEVAAGQPLTKSSDIYALGVLVLELVLGFVPMQRDANSEPSGDPVVPVTLDDVTNFTESIASGELAVAIPEDIFSSVEIFVRACCHRDPQKRPTAQELFSFPLVL